MNETAFLAFVATPAVVVLLGYVAVHLQERETARVRSLRSSVHTVRSATLPPAELATFLQPCRSQAYPLP